MSRSFTLFTPDESKLHALLRGMLVAFFLATTVLSRCAWGGDTSPSRQVATAQFAQAERAVAEAARHGALWTTARDALELAREALAAGDFSAALRHSNTAVEQARLGIAQLGYPPLSY